MRILRGDLRETVFCGQTIAVATSYDVALDDGRSVRVEHNVWPYWLGLEPRKELTYRELAQFVWPLRIYHPEHLARAVREVDRHHALAGS